MTLLTQQKVLTARIHHSRITVFHYSFPFILNPYFPTAEDNFSDHQFLHFLEPVYQKKVILSHFPQATTAIYFLQYHWRVNFIKLKRKSISAYLQQKMEKSQQNGQIAV